jgi:hypothetical protein
VFRCSEPSLQHNRTHSTPQHTLPVSSGPHIHHNIQHYSASGVPMFRTQFFHPLVRAVGRIYSVESIRKSPAIDISSFQRTAHSRRLQLLHMMMEADPVSETLYCSECLRTHQSCLLVGSLVSDELDRRHRSGISLEGLRKITNSSIRIMFRPKFEKSVWRIQF